MKDYLPPGFEDYSMEKFQSLVAAKLTEKEQALTLQRQQHQNVFGRRNILR